MTSIMFEVCKPNNTYYILYDVATLVNEVFLHLRWAKKGTIWTEICTKSEK